MSKCICSRCPLDEVNGHQKCFLHTLQSDVVDESRFLRELTYYIKNAATEGKDDLIFNEINFPSLVDIGNYIYITAQQQSVKSIQFNQCTFHSDLILTKCELLSIKIIHCKFKDLTFDECTLQELGINYCDGNSLTVMFSSIKKAIIGGTHFEGDINHIINKSLFMHNDLLSLAIVDYQTKNFDLFMTLVHRSLFIRNMNPEAFTIQAVTIYGMAHIEAVMPSNCFRLSECTLKKPNKLLVIRSNLSDASFKGTDVTEMNFIDNVWRRNRLDRIITLDERILRNMIRSDHFQRYGEVSFDQCAETYRQLKVNFDKKGNSIDAGNFHYGEMEMRYFACGRIRRLFSIIGIYRFLSGYGERPVQSLLVMITSFCILVGLHLIVGFRVENSTIKYHLDLSYPFGFPSTQEIAHSVKLTFGNLTLRSTPDILQPYDLYSTILWIFESIFGPIQIGMLILSIKRRVKR